MNKAQLEAIAEELTKLAKHLKNANGMVINLPDSKSKRILSSYLINVGLMTFYLGIWMCSVFEQLSDTSSPMTIDKFNKMMEKLMREKENDSNSETGK
ncbi:unnamed protein product [marine sediment metagenome]|uniref:Uncharacterized protein n=1 Tax=marine sediment metagenome TaxID=412755 RepID=X0SD68_9ZZZZ